MCFFMLKIHIVKVAILFLTIVPKMSALGWEFSFKCLGMFFIIGVSKGDVRRAFFAFFIDFFDRLANDVTKVFVKLLLCGITFFSTESPLWLLFTKSLQTFVHHTHIWSVYFLYKCRIFSLFFIPFILFRVFNLNSVVYHTFNILLLCYKASSNICNHFILLIRN